MRSTKKVKHHRSTDRIIEDPVFGFSFMIVKGGLLQDAINTFASRLPTEPWEVKNLRQFGHFAAHLDFKCGLLWFRDLKPSSDVVAHECLHATYFALSNLGIKSLNEETEEIFAYYQQWLIREVMR